MIAVVDPVSTGAALARYIADHGLGVVRVFSDMCPETVRNHIKAGFEVDWVETVQHETGQLASTVARLNSLAVTDILVGCESGVNLADGLCAEMGVRGNAAASLSPNVLNLADDLCAEMGVRGNAAASVSPNVLKARRNKFLQCELVRAAGLDAPKQMLAESSTDVEAFLQTFEDAGVLPFKAVCKPVEGAGSDGVSICNAPDEVRLAYRAFEGTKNVLGLDNYAVLLQEFLHGTEYVVDTVSRDGEHKVVAIWRYDKRDYHGAPVVYHGMRLLNVESQPALHTALVAYTIKVLDALHISNGAMHSEIMATPRGPVLVEVNCRLHGGEGIWLPIASRCFGYTQVSAMYDAYFAKPAFDAIPRTPPHPMLAHGAWVTVRSPSSGEITRINDEALETIRQLPSYFDEYLAPFVAVGCHIVQTIDACTVHGCFNLAHPEADTLSADYETAQLLVNAGLFDVQPEQSPDPKSASHAAAAARVPSPTSVYTSDGNGGVDASAASAQGEMRISGETLPLFGNPSAGLPSPILQGAGRRMTREIFGAEHQSPSAPGSLRTSPTASPVLKFSTSPKLMGLDAGKGDVEPLTLDGLHVHTPAAAPVSITVKIS